MSARRRKKSLLGRIGKAFTRGIGRTVREMGRELIPRPLRRKRRKGKGKGKGRGRSAWQTETVRRTRRPSRGGSGGGLGGGNPRVDQALIESGWGPVRAPRTTRTGGRSSGGGRSSTGRYFTDEELKEMGFPTPEEFEETCQQFDEETDDQAEDVDQGNEQDDQGDDPSSVEAGAV